jgi:hypothetical protein
VLLIFTLRKPLYLKYQAPSGLLTHGQKRISHTYIQFKPHCENLSPHWVQVPDHITNLRSYPHPAQDPLHPSSPDQSTLSAVSEPSRTSESPNGIKSPLFRGHISASVVPDLQYPTAPRYVEQGSLNARSQLAITGQGDLYHNQLLISRKALRCRTR